MQCMSPDGGCGGGGPNPGYCFGNIKTLVGCLT